MLKKMLTLKKKIMKLLRKVSNWVKFTFIVLVGASIIQFFVYGVATAVFWAVGAIVIYAFIRGVINMVENDEI